MPKRYPRQRSVRTAVACLDQAAAAAKKLLLLATNLVCKLINEVTHNLDTQFRAYRSPVETLAPP